jgi:hypothetical protein
VLVLRRFDGLRDNLQELEREISKDVSKIIL